MDWVLGDAEIYDGVITRRMGPRTEGEDELGEILATLLQTAKFQYELYQNLDRNQVWHTG